MKTEILPVTRLRQAQFVCRDMNFVAAICLKIPVCAVAATRQGLSMVRDIDRRKTWGSTWQRGDSRGPADLASRRRCQTVS